MSGHTPGPWKWRIVRGGETGMMTLAVLLETEAPNQPCNDPCVLALRDDWCGPFEGASSANKSLIAAAPELLEACRAAELLAAKVVAVSGLGARHEVVTDAITVRDAARAAIAKAEGGAA